MRTLQSPGLILITLLLSACGIDRGGITQPLSFNGAVVAGKIDDVDLVANKIEINGQEQSLVSTNILINGVAVDITQLPVGAFAVATTSATGQPGQPEQLEIDYNAAGGEITGGSTPDSLIQLGQLIVLDALNAPVPVADLIVPGNSNYAFSGYSKASGEIEATATIAYPVDGPALLTGYALNVDTSQFTFTIGNQVIDYSQASVIATQTGSVTENSRLRVELAGNTNDTVINAVSITEVPLVNTTLGENALISVSGYYATGSAPDNFFVSNLAVLTDPNTVFENSQALSLDIESLLLIEGVLNADGTVLAQLVRQLN